MAALTQARQTIQSKWKNVALPLGAALLGTQGGMACIDISAAVVKPGAAANANLIPVGQFAETFDNSAGTASVYINVLLDRELTINWFDSATGGNAVTSANLFAAVYILDDHTVTTSSSGNSVAGRVWAVDPVKGIGVASVL